MEARVQIMPVDKPTANGNLYPRSVVEKALKNLKGQPLAVTLVSSFLDNKGVPKVTDAIGVAKDLALDLETSTVIAHVSIAKIPDQFKEGFVIRSAGFGDVSEDKVISNFTFTGVVIGKE
jgi:hypothetical protein